MPSDLRTRFLSYSLPTVEEVSGLQRSAARRVSLAREERRIEGDLFATRYAGEFLIAEARTNGKPLPQDCFSADLNFVSRFNDGTYYELTARDVTQTPGVHQGQAPGKLRHFMTGYISYPQPDRQRVFQIFPPSPKILRYQIGALIGRPPHKGLSLDRREAGLEPVEWALPVWPDWNGPTKGSLLIHAGVKEILHARVEQFPICMPELQLPSPSQLAQAIFERLVGLFVSKGHLRPMSCPVISHCSAKVIGGYVVLQLFRLGTSEKYPLPMLEWQPFRVPLNRGSQSGAEAMEQEDLVLQGILQVEITEPWRRRYTERLGAEALTEENGYKPHSEAAWMLAWAIYDRLSRNWSRRVPMFNPVSRTFREVKDRAYRRTLYRITGGFDRRSVVDELKGGLRPRLNELGPLWSPHAGAPLRVFFYIWLMEDYSMCWRIDLTLKNISSKKYPERPAEIGEKDLLASRYGWIKNAEGEVAASEEVLAFSGMKLTTKVPVDQEDLERVLESTVPLVFGLLLKRVRRAQAIDEATEEVKNG